MRWLTKQRSLAAQYRNLERHATALAEKYAADNTGTGPGGHNIFTVKRARRAHSYLIVFIREELAKR